MARKRGQFPKPKNVGGKWRIWYRTDQAQLDGTIKRVQKCKTLGSVRAMTLRQAQKEALRILEPINEVQVGIEHSDKTMRQLITQWCKSVAPTLKHSTQESYAWAIKRVEPAFGHVPVAAVGGSDVQALLTAASGELSSISVRNLKVHLSGLLTAACEWSWILQNPARGRFRLPPKIPVQRRRVLSPEEFHRLVAALPQPYSTIVSLAGLSGLRAGELAALLWHHIEPGFVVVEQAVYRGKLGTPKSRHSAERVPIEPMTEKALTEWRGIAPLTGPDDYVFGLRTNGPLDIHNTAARHLKPAARRVGIGSVSWHDLGHTYCTWGRRAGIEPEAMQRAMRHASVRTTWEIYSHADDQTDLAGAIERYAWPETRGLM